MTLDTALDSGDLLAVAAELTRVHITGCPSAPCIEGPYRCHYTLHGTGLHRACKTHPGVGGHWMPDFFCCSQFNPSVCECEAIRAKQAATKENAA